MTVLVSDIGDSQDRFRVELTLDAYAVLIARGQFVVVYGKPRYVCGVNRAARCRTGRERYARVLQCDTLEPNVQAEGNIRAGVVHIVALNALVHDAKAAADHGLAAAS